MGTVDARVVVLAAGIAVVATAGAMYAAYFGAGPVGVPPAAGLGPPQGPPQGMEGQESAPMAVQDYGLSDPGVLVGRSDDMMERVTSQRQIVEIIRSYDASAGTDLMWGLNFVGEPVDRAGSHLSYDMVMSPQSAMAGAGAHEADHTKNDDEYVYTLEDGTLYIIRIHPPESAARVYKMDIDRDIFGTSSLLLDGDRLAVIYDGHRYWEYIPEFVGEPRRWSEGVTNVVLLDITDRQNPRIIRELAIEGDLEEARMHNGTAYIRSNSYGHAGIDDKSMPSVFEDGRHYFPEAYYFDRDGTNGRFDVITTMHMDDGESRSEAYMTPHTDNIYMAEDAFYVHYTKYVGDAGREGSFFGAVVPLLPPEVQEAVGSPGQKKWREISGAMQEWYGSMGDAERGEALEEIREAVKRHGGRGDYTTYTVIHKIGIRGLETQYVAKAEVPGTILSPFSVDRRDGVLRVTTGIDRLVDGSVERVTGVYLIDGAMEVVGGLEEIARNKDFFVTRFLGDRLYLVTLNKTEPLLVINASLPGPRVLGHLDLRGYSDHIHPYGPDRLLGIGGEMESDGTYTIVRMGVFDVSDISNPVMVSGGVFDGWDAYLGPNRNYKTLYTQDGLLSMPVYVRQPDLSYTYMFYFFDVGDDIRHVGSAGHSMSEWETGRTFRMGDVLYTVSAGLVRMTDASDFADLGSAGLQRGG